MASITLASKASVDTVKGIGWTDENLVDHEARIGDMETNKADKTVVDNNRLYSDSQYLELKAKADAMQVKCNTLQAEVYTDDPILQYGAVEIIGKGYESDNTPIDVSANVVDGSLELEQKGLTIRNMLDSHDVNNELLAVSASGVLFLGANGGLKIGTEAVKEVPLVSGDKYFAFTTWRTGTTPANINLFRYVIGGTTYTSTPVVIGMMSVALFTSSATGSAQFVWRNGTEGANYYHDNSQIVNLTALGLDHITDTDILAKLLPYVDGTKNVGKMGVRVVGENLANIRGVVTRPTSTITKNSAQAKAIITNPNIAVVVNYAYDGIFANYVTAPIILDNSVVFTTSVAGFGVGFKQKIKPLESVIFHATSNGNRFFLVWFEKDGTYISFTQANGPSITQTAPANAEWVIALIASNPATTITSSNIMLNLGSSAIPYEPYQGQTIFLPAIGNSLPNGVADSIRTVQ